jgi:hypothetical protein
MKCYSKGQFRPLSPNKKRGAPGDSLSPVLLNIVIDMLTILISRAREAEQIHGVVPHLIDEGPLVLQYANDTIIFIDNDLERAKNMKLLLCAFEQIRTQNQFP